MLRGAPAPHPVRMDAGQMRRVLTNLTDNALRYAGARPLVLTLTVWRDRDMEKLRFADNGRGGRRGSCPTCLSSSGEGIRPGGTVPGRAAAWGCIS